MATTFSLQPIDAVAHELGLDVRDVTLFGRGKAKVELTMPGLPREPAARRIKLLPDGNITGLMQNDQAY